MYVVWCLGEREGREERRGEGRTGEERRGVCRPFDSHYFHALGADSIRVHRVLQSPELKLNGSDIKSDEGTALIFFAAQNRS